MSNTYKEQQLKDFVIKLRKREKEILQQQVFCKEHNFQLELQAKRNESELLREIIMLIENEFQLGFVWDKSLD